MYDKNEKDRRLGFLSLKFCFVFVLVVSSGGGSMLVLAFGLTGVGCLLPDGYLSGVLGWL